MLVKMMVYGYPGQGKTVFLGSSAEDPRVSPALLLDMEAGTMSIHSKVEELPPIGPQPLLEDRTAEFLAEAQKAKPGKVYRLPVTCWDDMLDVMTILQRRDSNLPFKSLLIDSITEICNMRLIENFQEAKRKDSKPHDIPQIGDYGKTSIDMRELIRNYRNVKMHCFLSALAAEERDPQTGTVDTQPHLLGKLRVEVPAMVDIVGYLITKRGEQDNVAVRSMHFQPYGRVQLAKDRSEGGKLGDSMDNCTIPKVLDALGVTKPKG